MKSKKSFDDVFSAESVHERLQEITGGFQCGTCDAYQSVALIDPDTFALTWTCSEGHANKVSLTGEKDE